MDFSHTRSHAKLCNTSTVITFHCETEACSESVTQQYVLIWFPDPSSGGEREGSGELHAACVDPMLHSSRQR